MANYYVDNVTGNDTNNGTSTGSPWATLGKASSTATSDGDVVHVKNTGTNYTLTSTVTWGAAGVLVYGYNTTPGDEGGRPTVTSSTSGVHLFAIGADRLAMRHLRLTHTGSTRGSGIYPVSTNRNYCRFSDLVIEGCQIGVNSEYASFFAFMNLTMDGCRILNCVNSGVACASLLISNCYFSGNTGAAIRRGGHSAGFQIMTIYQCLINASGGVGISYDANRPGLIGIAQCTIRNSTSHGVSISGLISQDNAAADTVVLAIQNSLFIGNGGYAMNAANRVIATSANNGFFGNTSGKRSTTVASGVGDIDLSGDPFVSSSDYRLNSTTGAGAACRGVGTSPNSGSFVGSLDLGAFQSAPAASGSGVTRSRVINAGGI